MPRFDGVADNLKVVRPVSELERLRAENVGLKRQVKALSARTARLEEARRQAELRVEIERLQSEMATLKRRITGR